ncbi:L7Ae/L30e/S12e/Gadd45 family ribosomal protein [Enterococcus hailinensis]|uniref:L7Ae/L30e/S12e/Gadd45 family ribosomal protein n=1 Tax=Enterococcus hailinensis TaxID=3238988 RepID=UPI0038B2F73E
MDKQKVLNMLGLAMRAGKLITGEELTINDIRKNKVRLVIVTTDASENTQKKLLDKSKYYKTTCFVEFTQEEILGAIGKPRKVIGILDQGFAKKIMSLITG